MGKGEEVLSAGCIPSDVPSLLTPTTGVVRLAYGVTVGGAWVGAVLDLADRAVGAWSEARESGSAGEEGGEADQDLESRHLKRRKC